ncbi:MAG: helix-turn-helix transcriptional regulator [Ruminococcus sp.]|nr:helix-turn-helix transcriptional regulator [Ruminococcus sp.]
MFNNKAEILNQSKLQEYKSQEYLEIVGARLKGVRLLKGITQQQVARETGITQSFLSAVERGKKSICTTQIISLIKYYNVSYETIFGEHNGEYSIEGFSKNESLVVCSSLLRELISEYPSLEIGAENYLKICIYMLLRSIYRENPHNSQKIFSIDYDLAMTKAQKVIKNTPENLLRFIRKSKEINVKTLEIPIHHSGELRTFTYECEQMLCSKGIYI